MRGTHIRQVAGVERWRALPEHEPLPALEREQRLVAAALLGLQKAVCVQIAQGVVETLALSAWPAPSGDGVWVQLPTESDIGLVARAIADEGAAARPAPDGPYLLLLAQPWFDVEEIDQTVLCCAKVCHVMLGVHPPGMDLTAHLAEGVSCHWRSTVPAAVMSLRQGE